MQHFYAYTRYAFVGLFLVFNAINASVAVWNLSLIQLIGLKYPLDIYLTVVGACGLAMSFLIVFVEAAHDNPITGRVWFECTWVGLFLVMNFSRRQIGDIGCVSNRVILAFSWITIMILVGYLVVLTVTCLIRQKKDTRIWLYHIRDLDTPSSRLPSPPTSPTIPYFRQDNAAIVAPLPRRPGPSVNMMGGLNSSYDVEAYEPPPASRELPGTISSPSPSSQRRMQEPPRPQPNNPPSPLPLGDWPRADILSRPIWVDSNTTSSTTDGT
ncbi:hypothetical protein EV421DRAFT_1731838 [Armillaria borealis]|uniref:MARVEL domain-containing protein n=1 Tax=Armillaria borealis TaxID=47425 RepID=A0AA39JXI9_9AGAR|nr:hypothetical protein EV421DRAFT_1731838 [Armillaria borealis]